MEKAHQQLVQVKRLSRGLLVLRPFLQWTAAFILSAVILGGLDYFLLLPGSFRLAMGLMILLLLAGWLVLKLRQAMGLKIDLTGLALRAERLYPQLAGVLASGVEFAFGGQAAEGSPRTQALVKRAIDQANSQLQGVKLTKLIDPLPTLRIAAMTLGAMVLVVLMAAIWPDQFWLGTQRVFTPMADVQWPKRTAIISLMEQKQWPSDTPLRLKARVSKGHYASMRVFAEYRYVDIHGRQGPWLSQLMNNQATAAESAIDASLPDDTAATAASNVAGASNKSVTAGSHYELLLDTQKLVEEYRGTLQNSSGGPTLATPPEMGVAGHIELLFKTDDDQTTPQVVKLLDRPAVTGLTATIQPPAYAQGLVSPQTIDMHNSTGARVTARALAGSVVTLQMTFNKPLDASQLTPEKLFPGFKAKVDADPKLATEPANRIYPAISVSFRLDEPMLSQLHLVDQYGLESLGQRVYSFEPVADALPMVSMVKPVNDESVLATATVDLAASAQDDIGSLNLTLEMKNAASEDAPTVLTTVSGRQPVLNVAHSLDLTPLNLAVGSSLELWATGLDIYELDGRKHDPVKSAVRKVIIIDASTLAARLLADMAGVRQMAVRLQAQQQSILENEPRQSAGQSQAQQEQLSQRIEAVKQTVTQLEQRMERNKLQDPSVADLIKQSQNLLDQAKAAAESATQELGKSQQSNQNAQASAQSGDPARSQAQTAQAQSQMDQARAQQEKTSQELTKLVELLDQGKDAAALKMAIEQIARKQAELAEKTRQMQPRTLGKTPEQLTAEEKKALAQAASEQKTLEQETKALIRKMQVTAQSLSQPNQSASQQAAAQALSEAAQSAQQQGLTQEMQQAADAAEQNQLSSAAESQEQALATLQEMLQKMNEQKAMQQEILKRKIQQLAQAVAKLIEQQKQQIQAVEQIQQAEAQALGVALDQLDAPALTLRRNTTAVHDQMGDAPELKEAAIEVEESFQAQGTAVQAMRARQVQDVKGSQQNSLAHLETALRKLKEQQKEQQKKEEADKRAELRKAYEELAKEQMELEVKTRDLGAAGELDRRGRAQAVALGLSESQIQAKARELGQQVSEQVVFVHMHAIIDKTASEVSNSLRQGQADTTVTRGQKQVETALRQMASALIDPPGDEDEFSNGAGDEGGGGQGDAAKPPLVPPLAELRLLREVQQSLYQQTRAYDEKLALDAAARAPGQALPAPEAAAVRSQIIDLSGQQRELASLGNQLIEKLKQNQAPQPGGPGGSGGAEQPERPAGNEGGELKPEPMLPPTPPSDLPPRENTR